LAHAADGASRSAAITTADAPIRVIATLLAARC
jgi:hypothetical protein